MNNGILVAGGVLLVGGLVAWSVYSWKKDQELLNSMSSKDRADVMKARAYSAGAVGVAHAFSGTPDKNKKNGKAKSKKSKRK